MRTFSPTALTYLSAGQGVFVRLLVWIRAKDRDTGAIEAVGLWNDAYNHSFTIGGELRTYYGAGGLIGSDPLTMQAGLVVRMHQLTLSPLAPAVAQALRGYDSRHAPVEIHRALFSTETHNLIEEPHRVFRGYVDTVKLTTPEIGGEARAEVSLASAARALTIPLAAKKSDETQRRRGGDRFARYADVSGGGEIYWGEINARAPVAKPSASERTPQARDD